MGKKSLRDVIKSLKDRPLSQKEESLFVNRREEMLLLSQIPEYYRGDIIGVAGERGIGKTTLFNLLRFPGSEKVVVKVKNRESKLGVLADITSQLKEFSTQRGWRKASEMLQEILDWLLPTALAFSSPGASATWKLKRGKDLNKALRDLSKALEELSSKAEVVVVLDEIDKEREEELLLIMDSIKDGFKDNAVSLVVALPHAFYEIYKKGSFLSSDTYNLDNVFDNIFPIKPLSDSDVVEMLRKRGILDYIEEEALELILTYSNGNPRKAIKLVKESGILSVVKGEEKITRSSAKKVGEKYVRAFVEKVGISESELRLLKGLEKGKGIKELSRSLNISLPTVYRKLDKLEKWGLIERSEGVKLTRRGEAVLLFLR